MRIADHYKESAKRAYQRAKKWLLIAIVRIWGCVKWAGNVCGREPFNAIIAVATTIYVFVAAAQWSAMQDQIRLARQEFEASQRPWLSIGSIDVGAPLVFDKSGAHGLLVSGSTTLGTRPPRMFCGTTSRSLLRQTVTSGRKKKSSAGTWKRSGRIQSIQHWEV